MKRLANPYERNKSIKFIQPPKEEEPKTVQKQKSRNQFDEGNFNQTPLHPMPGVKSKILNIGLAPGVPARNAV